ncbi:D123-domain-containing protein [Lipomyces oligophaga]|uniref:D123-domain-containing protein n=1 Tax=Lipomyces oligophaga TaxID=45792 RepID=UPI0034CD4166
MEDHNTPFYYHHPPPFVLSPPASETSSPSDSPSSTAVTSTLGFPEITKEHIDNCAFTSWHPRYRKHVPKTTIIHDVDPEFVTYLLSDGIFLPSEHRDAEWSSDSEWSDDESQNVSYAKPVESNADSDIDWDADEDEVSAGPTAVDPASAFPELHQKIKEVIDLYGAVTPKLNWSSPRDAQWITATNSLKCVTPGDIYLILKSSNFITHDLMHVYDDCISVPEQTRPDKVSLVLRKWIEFNPSMEFRVFVRDRHIIAISQRSEAFYSFLSPLKSRLSKLILSFFLDSTLKNSFPDPDFVFDVYIPKPESGRVWLIDINPFTPRTDSLSYTWPELLAISPTLRLDSPGPDQLWPEEPQFRLVSQDEGVHTFSTKPFSEHMVPSDVVEASVKGGGVGIAEFAKQWKEMLDKSETSADMRSDSQSRS